jgi:ATP/maltotriose-dependent transcriptional regulator MalT
VRRRDLINLRLAGFADNGQLTLEDAAACWLGLQASTYNQDKEVAQLWAVLTAREQQVVALCCLEYSDHEIAAALDIAYGTARTHLYKAVDKLGINKKMGAAISAEKLGF